MTPSCAEEKGPECNILKTRWKSFKMTRYGIAVASNSSSQDILRDLSKKPSASHFLSRRKKING